MRDKNPGRGLAFQKGLGLRIWESRVADVMFRIWRWEVEGSGCKAQDLGFFKFRSGNQVRALDVELVVYVAPFSDGFRSWGLGCKVSRENGYWRSRGNRFLII